MQILMGEQSPVVARREPGFQGTAPGCGGGETPGSREQPPVPGHSPGCGGGRTPGSRPQPPVAGQEGALFCRAQPPVGRREKPPALGRTVQEEQPPVVAGVSPRSGALGPAPAPGGVGDAAPGLGRGAAPDWGEKPSVVERGDRDPALGRAAPGMGVCYGEAGADPVWEVGLVPI